MAEELEMTYPTVFVNYAELGTVMAAAMGDSALVGESSDDVKSALEDKGLLLAGELTETGKNILGGVVTGRAMIEIVLTGPDGFTSTTAFNGPEYSTVLTNRGEDNFRLMGMTRAHMMMHCAAALELLTLSMRNSVDLEYGDGFIAQVLSRDSAVIASALKKAGGVDQEYIDAVEGNDWSVRTLTCKREENGGAQPNDFLLVVRVGRRTFFVNPQIEGSVHKAYTVPPMMVWTEISDWFSIAAS